MEMNINGIQHHVDVEPDTPLLWALRDDLAMTGTKHGVGWLSVGPALCWSTDRPCGPA